MSKKPVRQSAVIIFFTVLLSFQFLLFYSCSTASSGISKTQSHPLGIGEWGNTPLVRTEYGLIRGNRDKEDTWSWKGIPYAASPVGDLRWRAPRDPKPWAGILSARSFGKPSFQKFPILGGTTGSEDCLFLNIWRPRSPEKDLPVYVWIHGGGNTIGSAHMVPDYYGHAFASTNRAVFVSINYRLGPFGWFLHPALSEGSLPEDGSGNYGTLDIIKSLEWIKKNISSFGGDPGSVTIAGESAGAMNILSLLTSPLAEGLFHRAVIQSGSTRINSRETAIEASKALEERLAARDPALRKGSSSLKQKEEWTREETAAWLRSVKAKDIINSLEAGTTGMTGWPTIIRDGHTLPEEGYEVFSTGEYPSKVPVIIGTNRDETKLFLFFDKSLDWREEYYQAVGKYGSQFWRYEGMDSVAEALTSHAGQPHVYAYRFDWGSPNELGESPLPGNWGARLGAFHSLEIPFFLGTDTINGLFLTGRLFNSSNRESRESLSRVIMAYLYSFIRTGNPNSEKAPYSIEIPLPRWDFWKTGSPAGLIFDTQGESPHLKPLKDSLTREGIVREMRENLPEPLFSEVLSRVHPR